MTMFAEHKAMCPDHDYLCKRTREELERARLARSVCARDVHLKLARLYAARLPAGSLAALWVPATADAREGQSSHDQRRSAAAVGLDEVANLVPRA